MSTSSTGPRTTIAPSTRSRAARLRRRRGSVVVATTISSHAPLTRAAATTHASTGPAAELAQDLPGKPGRARSGLDYCDDATHWVSAATTQSCSASVRLGCSGNESRPCVRAFGRSGSRRRCGRRRRTADACRSARSAPARRCPPRASRRTPRAGSGRGPRTSGRRAGTLRVRPAAARSAGPRAGRDSAAARSLRRATNASSLRI